MARQRMLHPDFFQDEKLVALPPLHRLFFAGMWGFVDREGRVEDKPLVLKMKILPADNCDGAEIVAALVEAGLLLRYEADGKRVLAVRTFLKYQNPHYKEAPSKLPPQPSAPIIGQEARGSTPDERPLNRAVSGKRYTVSGEKSPLSAEPTESTFELLEVVPSAPEPVAEVFEHWQRVMEHPKAGLDEKRRKVIRAALKSYSVEDAKLAIDGCAVTPHNMGTNDRGERYDGLHIIFASADNTDRFIRNARSPPCPPAGKGRATDAQKDWAKAKVETYVSELGIEELRL